MGRAHVKLAKSSLPIDYCLVSFGGLKSEETRHIGNSTIHSFNRRLSSLRTNRTQPLQPCWSHTAVGSHPIPQKAFIQSQTLWLGWWSLWHKQHAQVDPTSVQWG